jgi:hypothetical protein
LNQPTLVDPELAEFLESGVSVIFGSRDARFLGEVVRGVGARVLPGGAEVDVFLPVATADRTIANLRDNGRVALCFARIADHVTIQVKGGMLALGSAGEADRAVIDRYRRGLAANLGFVGLPARLGLRIAHWPAHAVRVAVEQLFLATPGPGAGAPLGARDLRGERR